MLTALALIPVIGLLVLIYLKDRKEKEPFWLLVILFFAGMSTVVSAILAETIGDLILEAMIPNDAIVRSILSAMLVVGPAEELGKYLVLRFITWRNRHFDHSYDAIVYAVFVSLGFAALENIGYVTDNGIGTAILRMLTSVPGHACFAVFMGYFYSKAKYASLTNKKGMCAVFKLLAIFVPTIIHGIYDAILFGGEATGEDVLAGISLILWIIYISALFAVSIVFVFKSSSHDFCIVTLPDKEQTIYRPVVMGSWTCMCGAENNLNFCFKCGKQRPTFSSWYCPVCGNHSAYNFCGNCGNPRPAFKPVTTVPGFKPLSNQMNAQQGTYQPQPMPNQQGYAQPQPYQPGVYQPQSAQQPYQQPYQPQQNPQQYPPYQQR